MGQNFPKCCNYFPAIARTVKRIIFTYFFNLKIDVEGKYFCNLLIKKEQPRLYLLLTLIRLLAQLFKAMGRSFLPCLFFPVGTRNFKIFSAFKKYSKLDFSNYHLKFLLSNSKKHWKNLRIKYCIKEV